MRSLRFWLNGPFKFLELRSEWSTDKDTSLSIIPFMSVGRLVGPSRRSDIHFHAAFGAISVVLFLFAKSSIFNGQESRSTLYFSQILSVLTPRSAIAKEARNTLQGLWQYRDIMITWQIMKVHETWTILAPLKSILGGKGRDGVLKCYQYHL